VGESGDAGGPDGVGRGDGGCGKGGVRLSFQWSTTLTLSPHWPLLSPPSLYTGLQSPHHWRRATLVHFRVLRKRALRRSIAILRGTDPNTTELRDFGKKGEAGQHTEL